MRKSKLLLVSVILSVLWMLYTRMLLGTTANNGMNGSSAQALGTAIGVLMLTPFMIVAWIGVIFNFVGWLTMRRGFVLTAGILMIVAVVIGFSWGFGLIPSIIMTFIGYARIGKGIYHHAV